MASSVGVAARQSPLSYVPLAHIRHPAPAFPEGTQAYMPSGDFAPIQITDYKGKYVVLFFWPMDYTFVCPTEIIEFSDRADEFRATNCEVLGCSVDSKFVHFNWATLARKKGGLEPVKIPMISDITKQISADYGVLLDHTGDAGVALRGTFIIDDKGVLRHVSMNDLPVGRSIDEILRLVKAFQFTDVHGEVCPAKWQPGAATMVPDVHSEKLDKYWQNVHGGH